MIRLAVLQSGARRSPPIRLKIFSETPSDGRFELNGTGVAHVRPRGCSFFWNPISGRWIVMSRPPCSPRILKKVKIL